jgi:hypothetical protein
MRADFIRVTDETINVPITIQLKNSDVSFVENGGFHHAELHVFAQVKGINGRIAQQFEDTVLIDIADALWEQQLDGARVHQRVLPLRPGRYKIDIVIKDLNTDNVGTVTQALTVPRFPEGQLATSTLIVSDLIEPIPTRQIGASSFVLGDLKVRPSVGQEFRVGDDFNYWLQVYNLTLDENTNRPSATIETLILRDGVQIDKIVETTEELSSAGQQVTIHETFMLDGYEPGEYSLQLRIIDNLGGNVTAPTAERFVVRPARIASN